MADTREILLKLLGRETVSTAAKKAARGLGDMGDAADDAARDTKNLDKAIGDTQKTLAKLRSEASRSADPLSFVKDINRQKRNLKSLTTLMAEAGDDGAKGFRARFVARLGPLMAHAPIGPALAVPIAAAAPMLASVLSSALAGGAGLGVIGAGIALQFQDPKVQAAASRLGLTIKSTLTDASAPLRDETLDAIQDVRNEVQKMGPELREIFALAAPETRKFTAGLTGGIREALPGIKSLTRESGSFADVWQRRIPAFGKEISRQFDIIAGGADESAAVLEEFFAALQLGVATIGPSIRLLSETAGFLDRIGALTGGFLPLIEKLVGTRNAADQTTPSIEETVGALDKLGAEAVGTSGEIKTLADTMREWEQANRSAVSAEVAFEEAIDAATAAAKENGRTTDTNTAKGRANMTALNELAGAAVENAQAIRESTGSQERANAAMQRGYNRFVAAAQAMGMSKTKADQLARSLGLIPPGKTITIRYPTMSAAEIKARALASAISSIDTYKEIQIVQRLSTRGVRVAGVTGAGGFSERAAGGPLLPGKRYLVGERGPELLEMGSQGGHMTPNHRLGGGGGSTASMAHAVAAAIAGSGLQVVMDGNVVGRLQGKRADLLARGG